MITLSISFTRMVYIAQVAKKQPNSRTFIGEIEPLCSIFVVHVVAFTMGEFQNEVQHLDLDCRQGVCTWERSTDS